MGQQADQIVAFDKAAVFIEEKAAVKITIPGDAYIRFVLDNGIGCGGPVFGQKWVGYAVGKGSIWFMVYSEIRDSALFLQVVGQRLWAIKAR